VILINPPVRQLHLFPPVRPQWTQISCRKPRIQRGQRISHSQKNHNHCVWCRDHHIYQFCIITCRFVLFLPWECDECCLSTSRTTNGSSHFSRCSERIVYSTVESVEVTTTDENSLKE
jgi:hypothetical protein